METVAIFIFLRSTIIEDGIREAKVRSRIAKATASLHKMESIWKNKKVSTRTKIPLDNGNVVCVMFYGGGMWSFMKQIKRMLDAMDSRSLQKVMRIGWQRRGRNTDLRKWTK